MKYKSFLLVENMFQQFWLQHSSVYLGHEDIVHPPRSVYRRGHIIQPSRRLVQNWSSQDLFPDCFRPQQHIVFEQQFLAVCYLYFSLNALIAGFAQTAVLFVFVLFVLLDLSLLVIFVRLLIFIEVVFFPVEAFEDVAVLLGTHVVLPCLEEFFHD